MWIWIEEGLEWTVVRSRRLREHMLPICRILVCEAVCSAQVCQRVQKHSDRDPADAQCAGGRLRRRDWTGSQAC